MSGEPMRNEREQATSAVAPPAAGRQVRSASEPLAGNTIARYVLYTVLLLGVVAGKVALATADIKDGGRFFTEAGPVETVQIVTLLAAALVLVLSGWRQRTRAVILWPLAGIMIVAGIRELDRLLDHLLPLLGWQLPAGVVVFLLGWYVVHNWSAIGREVRTFVASPAFGVLWAGFVIVAVFGQVIGQSQLWEALMADAFDRNVKQAVEESVETFGYLLLAIGAVETSFSPTSAAPGPHRLA